MSTPDGPRKPRKAPESAVDRLLPDPRELAIDMKVRGTRWSEIARRLGVDRKTVYRWRQDQVFQAELRQRRQERDEALDDRLADMVDASLDTLEQIRDNPQAKDADRIRAADIILARGPLRDRREPVAPEAPGEIDREALTEYFAAKLGAKEPA